MYTITKELSYSIMNGGANTEVYKVTTKKKKTEDVCIFSCVGSVKEFPIFHEITRKGEKIPVVDAVVLKIKTKLGQSYFAFFGKDGKPYIRQSANSIIQLAECKGKYKKMFLEKLV